MLLQNTTIRQTLVKKLCHERLLSHMPVMAAEIVNIMKPDDGKVYIDMTFGGGGHSRKLLSTNKSITIIAADRDPIAIKKAQELSKQISIKSDQLNINQRVIPVHGKFSNLKDRIRLQGIEFGTVHGILFDLGASSLQYDDPNRGFSISSDSTLDMRMDTSDLNGITAEDVINNLDLPSLCSIFKILGEERRSMPIANAILDARALMGRIKTTQELARIVHTSRSASMDSLGRYAHPATKVFQALRIFVNNELNEINYGIDKLREFLVPCKDLKKGELDPDAGVALVLTFHSLEDKIIKKHFNNEDIREPNFKSLTQHDRIHTRYFENIESIKEYTEANKWKSLFKHVIKPSNEEVSINPRARSAKLRAAVRLS